MSDSSGYLGAEGALAATNWWNPFGWIMAAVVIVEVVVLVAVVDEAVNSKTKTVYYEKTNSAGNSQSVEGPAAAAPAAPQPPNNNNNNRNNRNEKDYVKASSNKVANKWAQRAGWDSAEAFKRDFVWNQGSRFDMYYDRVNNVLLLIEKATGLVIETGVTFLR